MDAPETVVDAVRLLKEEGYEIEFQLVDGHLACDVDDRQCSTGDAVVERLFRFEGPSDPGDEMIVFGLRDPVTGRRGVLAGPVVHLVEVGRAAAEVRLHPEHRAVWTVRNPRVWVRVGGGDLVRLKEKNGAVR